MRSLAPTLVPSSWVAQSGPLAFAGVSVDYVQSGLNLNVEICMELKVSFHVRVAEGAGRVTTPATMKARLGGG